MAIKYYAYLLENKGTGIVNDWESCKKIVAGSKARYKSFKKIAEAEEWLRNGANYDYGKKNEKTNKKINIKLEEGIYFDAGTGRGKGVEVRLTDKNKNSILNDLLDDNLRKFISKKAWFINEFDNILLDKNRTNNYGELLGLYLALEYAKRNLKNKIYGDSKLVIDYWSLGRFKRENLEKETILLIEQVTKKRKEFEKSGGKVNYVSGDINPADLGFHK